MKSTKKSLFTSVLALFLCFSMLLGTTFAWFTDVVTSGNNKIVAGSLKVDLELFDKETGTWESIKNSQKAIFNHKNWEPGYTEVKILRITNKGSLALKWDASIIPLDELTALADVIDVYVYSGKTAPNARPDRNNLEAEGYLKAGTLREFAEGLDTESASALLAGESDYLGIALKMRTKAGDEYQNLSCGEFDIRIVATQYSAESEKDSFDENYDSGAQFPVFKPADVNLGVKTQNGVVTEDAYKKTGNASMKVSAGTKTTKDRLGLTVSEMATSSSNVTLEENEIIRPLDVHVDGVASDNTKAIIITLDEAMMTGLNIGNYKLYHVEDGVANLMTAVSSLDELDAHNEFYYDPATGNVSLAMATFSEVAVVADTENAWEGNLDYSWYDASKTELTIANADQLAAFGAIVGGMKKVTGRNGDEYTYSEEIIKDSFKDKTIKLIADINIGDVNTETVDASENGIVFYPIGYYNSEGTYERTNTAITSGLRNFEGTFDGNGHTVSNFYQNTWEMKGDHNWYSPEEQYYRDGMGLFGRVYKGTVKNLTVRNFSSDGEIATTGVIAAYADGATFENITIFNCNPRVYNIGNGGIVGCVGWYAKAEGLKTTFKNITVDNSNKISALWGSYDVACGGIVGQYYPTSGQSSVNYPVNAGIHFENCHISAQMDVYNDVCANYQYYAYRYAGMLIGSVRENETIDGHVYPKMDGITAEDCTVHFGTWNDYYYCEIIDNTTASYTHDYQMSRLTEIKAIDGTTITYLDGTTGTVPASGRANYVIVDYTKGHGTENATCYHFKDGAVWNHEDGGKETINGVEVLKEDKQHIYLEFNNLVTGYGWGVTSKGLTDFEGVENMDITEGDHEKSVEKFSSTVTTLSTDRVYTIDEIFSYIEDCGVKVVDGAVSVTITNLDKNGNVIATFNRGEKWNEGTISFENTGNIAITIQDYYFCTPTTIEVTVTERQPAEKFDIVMNNGDFLHRVGNSGTVALDKLFKAKDGVTVGTVSVSFEAVNGTSASGTYSNNAIQFSGIGVVKVTITDNDYCTPTVLYLEVVDATNVTSATDAKDKDIVLLNNIGSGFTVDNGHTVYGNGFTLNYTGDGRYLNNGLKQGVVMVQNGGTLDNLRIKAPIYPTAFMYYGTTQLGDYVQQSSNPREVEGEKTRYYYQLSAVATYGSATISNCYIYGGRTNIYVNTGNVTIKDSILECGVVANVQIQSTNEYTVTLENLTTIQYRVNATIGDTSNVMLGAGVLVGPETTSNPKIILNGNFKQYNWVNEDDKNAVSGTMAQMIIGGALDATAYNHTVNGKTSSNLGIIYMNTENAEIKDNTNLPYVLGNVAMKVSGSTVNGQVYSLQNATANQIYSDYVNADRTTVNGDYIPRFDFNLGNQELSYDGAEDTRYLYGDANGVTALYQDGDAALTLDLTKLATIYKYDGKNYTVTAACKDSSGNTLTATNGVVTLNAQGDYTLVFTVDDNIFYNKNGETITKSVERTYTVPLTLTVKEADVKNAVVNITKTALDGVYTTVNLTDYKLRINFLDCIGVTDYDNKGTGTTVSLSSNISSVTLTPSGVNVFTTASTITVTYTDGRVLTVNISKISGSSPGTKTATVNTSGGLYFITDGALDNKPTATSSQNKCTITSVSFKGNSGSTVTNDTDVTVTWALGSSGSCLAAGTMITLADGTKRAVEDLRKGDMVMSFDHVTGEIVSQSVTLVGKTYADNYYKNTFVFDDGTELVTINEHGIYDLDLKQYVNIDHNNYLDYIGHRFASVDSNGKIGVKTLVNVVTVCESGYKYDVVTNKTFNYVSEDTLSVSHEAVIIMNTFVFGDDMLYDADAMQADIEKYGLYSYDEWSEYCELATFEQYNLAITKIGVEKGLYTKDHVIYLLTEIALNDDVQITE